MTEIDKLAWLHIKGNQLLGARSQGKVLWYIPGGKRDAGESDHETLIREIKEELSVDLVPSTIKYANTFTAQAHGKPEGTIVKVTCYFAEYTGEIKADAEIEEVTWLSHKDKARCSSAAMLILDWLKSERRID